MIRRPLTAASCCVLLSTLYLHTETQAADSPADAFVQCAARVAVPFNKSASFAPLQIIVGGAQVVAQGEPAHGAPEPLQLRNRVIKYLVEQMGFTAVALETSFAESEAVNDFVRGQGSASQIGVVARQQLSWGFGAYPENETLLRWLRDYNADPLHVRKVGFYGIDLSGADHHGSFSGARDAVDHAVDLLQGVDAAQAGRIRTRLSALLTRFSEQDYRRLSQPQRGELTAALASLAQQLRSNHRRLRMAMTEAAYAWALQKVAVAQTMQAYFQAAPLPSEGDDLRPDGFAQEQVRDHGMAENVQWIVERAAPAGRTVVFAHNGHVMNAELQGGIWSVYSKPPRTMGQFLRTALGDRMAIMGILAAGVPRQAQPMAELAEATLERVAEAPYVLDLRRAACTIPAAAWLTQRRPVRANFDTAFDVQLDRAFDAILFLDRITPYSGHRSVGEARPAQ